MRSSSKTKARKDLIISYLLPGASLSSKAIRWILQQSEGQRKISTSIVYVLFRNMKQDSRFIVFKKGKRRRVFVALNV